MTFDAASSSADVIETPSGSKQDFEAMGYHAVITLGCVKRVGSQLRLTFDGLGRGVTYVVWPGLL